MVGGYHSLRAMAARAVADLGTVRRDPRSGRWYLDLRPVARVYTYRTPWGDETAFATELDAARALDLIRSHCADGMPVAAAIECIRPREGSRVPALAREWLREKWREVEAGRRVARSIRELELSVAREWGWWEAVPVHQITSAAVRAWALALGGRGLAPATVRAELARFRSFCAWLYSTDRLQRLPAFPRIEQPDRHRATLTWEQQDAVLEAIPEEQRGVFLAGVDLALRPQEARALLAVDLEGDGVWIRRAAKDEGAAAPVGETKTGRHRYLPWTDRLRGWCDRYVPREARFGGLAFPAPGGGMWSAHELRKAWRAASEAAGVPYVAVRDATRRSSMQELRRRANAPLSAIRDLAGHRREETTRIYLGSATGELVGVLSARRASAEKPK